MFFELLDDLLLPCRLKYLFNACFQPCKRGQKIAIAKKLVFANSAVTYGLFMIVCYIIFIGHPEPIKLI